MVVVPRSARIFHSHTHAVVNMDSLWLKTSTIALVKFIFGVLFNLCDNIPTIILLQMLTNAPLMDMIVATSVLTVRDHTHVPAEKGML